MAAEFPILEGKPYIMGWGRMLLLGNVGQQFDIGGTR